MRSPCLPRFLAFVLLLAGCAGDINLNKDRVDADGDGYTADVDCDDAHYFVNPDAPEECDGFDNDCDGTIDVGAVDASTFWADLDGDGHGDPASPTQACEPDEHEVDNDDDCDDDESRAWPGNDEVCDGVDNDCDGGIDEDAVDFGTWFEDHDGDGHGNPLVSITACEAPEGYVDNDTDCDDGDAAVHPGASETDCTDPKDYNCDGSTGYTDADGDGSPACEDCDDDDPARSPRFTEVCDSLDVDEDCDGLADDLDPSTDPASRSTWYRDVDADGYSAGTGASLTQCEQPAGYSNLTGDCDDYDRTRNPGATEVCDALDADEDCDGLADDADPSVSAATWRSWYRDWDGDTYGDASRPVSQCDAPSGYVSNATDCDDTSAARNPGATEVCDASNVDEDCDGLADDDDSSASGRSSWYLDADGDTWGLTASLVLLCDRPSGYVATSGDCDDGLATVNPGATELCDASNVDEDCDGLADDADSSATGKSTWYRDADSDGYGTTSTTTSACDRPSGYASVATDCDDANAAVNPGASEVCDALNVDEDCDGLADDADPSATGKSLYYRDADSDTYGSSTSTTSACDLPTGYVTRSGDCNDGSSAVNPAATEVCDALDVDEDCDGLTDDADPSATGRSLWYRDADADAWGTTSVTTTACDRPTGYVALPGDCDDAASSVNPGATEVCDASNVDEDCDGYADDLDSSPSGRSTWYRDADSDGYGTSSTTTAACDRPTGFVSTSGDCDDAVSAINPGATEVCDAANADEDCDGLADDADTSASGKSTWYRDADSDTWGASSSTLSACDLPSGYVARAGDCNDSVTAINPDATEVCDPYDVDEDCDGLADDADPSVTGGTSFYFDGDSDGYGVAGTTAMRCDAGGAWVATATDCDDTRASVNPGAAEDCGTSTDDDCSGDTNGRNGTGCTNFYADVDGDGYGTGSAQCWCAATSTYRASAAGDCDDGNASARPGGTEICGDSVDQDCSGADLACPSGFVPQGDICLDAITTRAEGATSNLYLGGKPSEVLDLNGDGWDDLLVPATGSSTGTVYLVRGPFEGSTLGSSTDPTATINGAVSSDYAYVVSRIGDHDNDGRQDFAVGATGWDSGGSAAGGVFVLPGTVTDTVSLTSSYPAFYGEGASYGLGNAVAPAGDVNADGYDDMLVGSQGYGTSSTGRVYLLHGPFAVGARNAGTYAATTWTGETTGNYAGSFVVGDVDLNNDGHKDVIISAHGYNTNTGRVYVYHGPFASGAIALGTSTASAVFTGKTTSDYFGRGAVAVVPDMNGDGYDELAIGAYGNDDAASSAGKVYVYFGPFSGTYSTSAADITVSGMVASDWCGNAVAGIEDIDGDGGGELLVGCYGFDYASVSASGVGLLFNSGAAGELDVLDADALFYGSSNSDYAGYTVGPAGDFDADGVPDFYIGALYDEYRSTSYTNTGLVYFVAGNLDNMLVNAYDGLASGITNLGYRVSAAGDFNNDGYADVIGSSVATNGTVGLFLGPWSTSTTAAATITGDAAGDSLGFSIDGGGRVNSDVYADLVLGAPYADSGASNGGEVYVIAGRSTPISYTAGTSAFANYYGATANEYLGYSVTLVDDWDGDGLDDIAMGAQGYSSSSGRAFLVTAPVSGTAALITSHADSSFTSSTSGVTFGYAIDGDGDLDGDGYSDVVIGAPGWDVPVSNAGAAFVYFGGSNAAFTTSTADATLFGEASGDSAGTAVAILGDTNHDGYDDLLVGAPYTDIHASNSGTVYLLLGPFSGSIDLGDADARLDGVIASEYLGASLDGAGDVNGDGYADWLAGSNLSNRAYGGGGTVLLVHGPETGVLSPWEWHGPYASSYAGQAAGVGDNDGDGLDDYAIGGYGRSQLWLFQGE